MSWLAQAIKTKMDLDLEWDQLQKDWRRECNEKGLVIFYDMTNAKEVKADCECQCDCDCTMMVGKYNTKPCPNHYPGHQCNLVENARIIGFGP